MNARGYLNTTVYDQNARVVASVNAVNAITTNLWDNAGRQIAMQDAFGYLHTTVYDHNSQAHCIHRSA
jgi:flagellar basal body-associated protein FliL